MNILKLLLLVALSFAQPVFGQSEHRVSVVALQHGMWRFTPIYTVADGHAVVNALAGFAVPGTTIGQNVVAVMYTRDAGGAWQCKAWETTYREEVVKDLKLTWNTPDADDELWELPDSSALVAAVRAEHKDFKKGLFRDDPLSTVLNTPETRAVVLSWLKDAGLAVAVINIDKPGDTLNLCRDTFLSWVKQSAELVLDNYLLEVAKADPLAPAPGTTPAPGNPLPIVPNGVTNPCMFLPPDQGALPTNWLNNNCLSFWYYKPMTYASTLTCGAWGMFVYSGSVRVQVPIPLTPGYTFPPTVTSTCYTRNCVAYQNAIITWYDWCTHASGSFHVFRQINYVENCCISGLGGPPPPVPCTPKVEEKRPGDWGVPPPAGIAPFPGDTFPPTTPR